jgi:uncharacterized membrane protein
MGVNDQGDAAGTADPSAFFTFTAFFYDAAADEIVQVAPQGSRGWDINNAGQVTGHVGSEAFRWSQSGGLQMLGPLDDTFSSTFGYTMNEDGTVAGEARNPQSSNSSRAFVFTDESGMEMIPAVGGENRAWGINDHGAVVGEAQNTGSGDKGWIWTPAGGVQVLNDLIDPAESMTVIAAYDINDSGRIVALAFDNDLPEFVGVVLIPNPLHHLSPERF